MEKLTEKEQQIVDSINKSIEEKTKGMITQEAMTKAITDALKDVKFDIAEDPKFKEQNEILKAHGVVLTALKDKGTGSDKAKSIRDQITEQLEAKKEEITAFQKNPQGAFTIELKAAGSMRVSTNASGTNLPVAEVEAGITMPLRRALVIRENANVGRSSSVSYQYVQGVNRDGNAAIINDATIAPLVDFDLKSDTSNAIDVVGATNVHANMLTDIEGLQSEIENNLSYELDLQEETALVTYVTGIAGAFVDPGMDVTTPNEFDAINACVASIATVDGMATTALINHVDYAQLIGAKGSDGHYVMPPFAIGGREIAGATIVPSNSIAAGNVLVYDKSKFNILDYQGLEVTFGWDGANGFRDRIITILGVKRLHRFVKSNHTACFVYDSFADIKAAILAV